MKSILDKTDANLNRPYEKCLRYGAKSLNDQELLAIILRSGTKGHNALSLAGELLNLPKDGSGLLGMTHLSMRDLMSVKGIGEVKAIQIAAISELSKRIATSSARRRLSFNEPSSIADYYMEQLRHEERECLVLIMLDTKMHLIADSVISKGTVDASLVSTREIFIEACRCRAVQIILMHNHPSGDPSPSREDLMVTEKVKKAGELLDIDLVDHIIIGDRCYVSLFEAGILK